MANTELSFPDTLGARNVTVASGAFDLEVYWIEMNSNHAYLAGEFLRQYSSIILSGIGVPCNILTFLIMKRLKPLSSTTLIMMILAVADTANLLYYCGMYQLMYYIFSSDAACQAHWTVAYLLVYLPIWLVMLLTFERLVAVCFPMKVVRICTVSNALRAVILLVIMDALMSTVHTFVYEVFVQDQKISCQVKYKYDAFMDRWLAVDAVYFVVIPLTFLSLGNIVIIVKLRISAYNDNLKAVSSSAEESKRQHRSVTVMLVAISITTIICITPNALLGFGGGLKWLSSNSRDINADAMKYFGFYMIQHITVTNNALNFFVYVLSGRRFRAVFFQMISCSLVNPLKHTRT